MWVAVRVGWFRHCPSTLSSSIPVNQEIRCASVTPAPQTPMPGSHRTNQSLNPSTPRVVPQPVHGILGCNRLTFPIMQEAPRSTPRRQGQLLLSDPQSSPLRPPKTTPKNVPKPGNLFNNIIDLCSSDDEGPMDGDHSTGGRSSHTQAQGPEDGGSRTGEESDSDYWSICLSDDDRETRVQAPDPVDKVQPTHIQNGWIPPVSSFTMVLHGFPIGIVYLDFHRTSSSS
jgi:hypothetical protein